MKDRAAERGWGRLIPSRWLVHGLLAWLVSAGIEVSGREVYRVRIWNSEEGLPQNWVECLCQTREGYLYVGTRSGLVRFDGLELKLVAPPRGTLEFKQAPCLALFEDREGWLWIGTKRGLGRWREDRFEQFTRAEGLADDDVKALAQSRDGGVWIGTASGLNYWRAGRFTGYLNPVRAGEAVRAVQEDAQGTVWVASFAGLHRLDPATSVFTPAWIPPRAAPTQKEVGVAWLQADRQGRIWFDAAPGSGWVEGARVHAETGSPPAGGEAPRGMFEDRRGVQWMFSAAGLFRREGDGWTRPTLDVSLDGVSIRCALEDRDGNLWLGTEHHGLWRLRPQSVETFGRQHGLEPADVWSISASPEGDLWLGTSRGVRRYHGGRFEAVRLEPDVSRLSFRPVLVDREGDLWLGATDRDFFHFRREPGGYRHLPKPSAHPQTRTLYQDRSGAIWIGTKGGVARFRPRERVHRTTEGVLIPETHGEQWIFRHNEVRYLAAGAQWIGREGFWWRDGDESGAPQSTADLRRRLREAWTEEIPEGQLAGDNVSAILEDREGAMWFGTEGDGLSRLRDGVFTTFTARDGLSGNTILALHEDDEGTLWIGTPEGLTRRRGDQFTALTTAHGLFDNLVNQIVDDARGSLWFGCHRGLFRARRTELNAVCEQRAARVRCLALGEGDGMASSQTNGEVQPAGCRVANGTLWFPTVQGVAVVDPADVDHDPVPPTVIIEQVRATGLLVKANPLFDPGPSDDLRRAEAEAESPNPPPSRQPRPAGFEPQPAQRVRLPPGSGRFIEFKYASPNLTAAEQVKFRYRLEGQDADWIAAGSQRNASYANLGPGRYCFRVIARNRHGLESQPGAVFAFEVAPTLAQAAWFRLALAGGLATGAYALHRRRLRLRMHLAQLEAENRLAQERARIGRDLHDDLGASLARAAVLVTIAQRDSETAFGSAASLPWREVEEAIQASQQTMREVIWATNPRNDTLDALMTQVCQFAQEYLEPLEIRRRFELPPEVPAIPLSADVRRNLFLAAKEAIRNAAQHAHATEVRLTLRTGPGRGELVIADNGRGIPTAPEASACAGTPFEPPRPVVSRARTGEGLANMRHRLETLGGRLTIAGTPGAGTTVSLQFPTAL